MIYPLMYISEYVPMRVNSFFLVDLKTEEAGLLLLFLLFNEEKVNKL